MLELLQYPFFQNALIGALLVSIACGIIGTYIVIRRLVFISGGITHASFGGLGLGFFLGVNPTFVATIFAILSAMGVQFLTQREKAREDSAIAVIWSLGMALGVLFVFLTPGYTPSLSEFLFGNILTITSMDLIYFALVALLIIALFMIGYNSILFIAFDKEFAKTKGIRVDLWETIMMIAMAITIVLTIRLVGIVLLMSLLTIPQMTANLFTKNFRSMILLSVLISIGGSLGGLICSYYLNVPSGAFIILTLIVIYGATKLLFLRKAKEVKHSL